MPNFVGYFLTLFLSSLLSQGCTSQPPIQTYPEITFSHLQTFKVNVGKIEVENRFRRPLKAPHIEHLLSMPPSKALEQWLRDRFKPVGRSGTLRLIIEDAKVTEMNLDLDTSFKGHMTKQQSKLYKMIIRASLELRDTNGETLGTASSIAERSITTREDISINERQKLWLETVINLVNDFNQSIEPSIHSYLGVWLR